MDQNLFWMQVGAIGQVAGSIATFLAVAVTLWIVLSERKENIRLTVGEREMIPGDINGPVPLISFSVTNIGLIPVRITTFGWEVGWFRRGPSVLKKRYAIQSGGEGLPGKEPPFTLEPGHNESFLIRRRNFLENLERDGFFACRNIPILGPIFPRICGSAYTARGTKLTVSIKEPLRNSLKQRMTIPN